MEKMFEFYELINLINAITDTGKFIIDTDEDKTIIFSTNIRISVYNTSILEEFFLNSFYISDNWFSAFSEIIDSDKNPKQIFDEQLEIFKKESNKLN